MLTYKYALVFAGLVIGGDFVLVPVVYSTHLGLFSVYELVVMVVISELISDVTWYVAGRTIGEERLYTIPFLKHKPHIIERTSAYFRNREAKILFTSKFIYGTRVVTQILCAAHRMSFPLYLFVNLAGYLTWTFALFGIVSVVGLSVSSLQDTALRIQVSFALIAAIVIGFLYAAKKVSRAWWPKDGH